MILDLEGDKLTYSELHFAYQSSSGTTMCSWAVSSLVQYFNRSEAAVYGAAMDMTKAFNMVVWSKLFELLIRKVNHLGNILEIDNSLKSDMALKRGRYIRKVNYLLQEFHNVNSDLLMHLINVYAATNLYRSYLLYLRSKDADKLYTSLNLTIRNVFKLDLKKHTGT